MTCSPTFLIEPEHVAVEIPKPRDDLTVITRRLHDLTTPVEDTAHRLVDVFDHHVDEDAGVARRRPPPHPGPTDLPNAVIERVVPVAAPADDPAKDCAIESGGSLDIGGRDLDVADLAIDHGAGHRLLLRLGILRERFVTTGYGETAGT